VERVAIVIGAGPAGLAVSLGLSGVCSKVLLCEKHPVFDKRGSTFGLALNGQKTLDELQPGLRKHMANAGVSGGPSGVLVFLWWQMRDILLHHVKQAPNIQLHCGEEFSNITQSEDGVVVSFKSGLELEGSFLVGADGVNSKVREVLQLPVNLVSDTTNYRGSIEVKSSSSPELQDLLNKGVVPLQVATNGGAMYFLVFNFHQRHPGRLAWILATKLDVGEGSGITPHSIAQKNVKDAGTLKLIKEIFDLSEGHQLQPYPKTSIVDMSDSVLAGMGGGWGGKGCVTLVGDAAHAMRPTDGYGGSMAFEDAVVLSRILKKKKNNSNKKRMPALLRKFEKERLPRVKRVYDNQFERYELQMSSTAPQQRPPQSKEFLEWLSVGV
ncbi:unnamed protein product, partial [Heterosigma akashiwo]